MPWESASGEGALNSPPAAAGPPLAPPLAGFSTGFITGQAYELRVKRLVVLSQLPVGEKRERAVTCERGLVKRQGAVMRMEAGCWNHQFSLVVS